MKSQPNSKNGSSDGKVQRISVSLPDSVFRELDQLVTERGLESRSKAIADMVTHFALEHQEDKGDGIMAGTITIVYDESKGNLLQRLAELERGFVDEVIEPAQTRPKLIRALALLENKRDENPRKKHGNIPL